MKALELGAVDFVAKPRIGLASGLSELGAQIVDKLRVAAVAKFRRPMAPAPTGASGSTSAAAAAPKAPSLIGRISTEKMIVIGASTGGTEAIKEILVYMPADSPAIVITQHMPPGFTSRFAARLDEVTELKVVEAEDRMPLENGHAYVARGDHHLRVERSSGQLKCRLTQDELASGHRPSVDVLFESVAKTVGPMAVGAILTGLGRDGARGLKLMRDAGAYTVGQSQGSALVYGMPRVAFEEGAVIEQAAIEGITARLAAALTRIKSAA
jgi:two-component system chemotaxis response regulator CheB